MDVQYVNPFIRSLTNAMETMLAVKPVRLAPMLKSGDLTHGDISGIIGFASVNIFGSIALSFPSQTAIEMYNRMVGERATEVTGDVRDSVGEMTNIVAGGAKKDLAEMDLSFDLSIPTVVMGKNHSISHKAGTPVMVIPFQFDNFKFEMEISLKVTKSDTVSQNIEYEMLDKI